MTDFHNVKVTLHSRDGDYCLQWETTEARYHVWVTHDWFLRRGIGLRAPTLYEKPHNDNPHGRISRLDATKNSSSASRFTAGASGFFILSQSNEPLRSSSAFQSMMRPHIHFEHMPDDE